MDLIFGVSLKSSSVDDVVNGKLRLNNGTVISCENVDAIWHMQFQEDAVVARWAVLTLDWLEDLLIAFEKNGNNAYWEAAERFLGSFINYLYDDGTPLEEKLLSRTSVEHAYYTRICIFIRALTLAPADWPLRGALLELVEHHAHWLADPANRRFNNHDLMTQIGLLHATVFFQNSPVAAVWEKTALERIADLLDKNFDDDGMNNENTPGYHEYNIQLFDAILDFLNHYGINNTLSDKIISVLDKAKVCYQHLIWQNGCCPPIGDDVARQTPYKSINSSCFYKTSGFSVIKDDDLWLCFRCGYGLNSHMHHDALSIFLRYKDVTLITDGGKYNYDAASPIRQRIISSAAHSSLYPVSMDSSTVQNHFNVIYPHAGLDFFQECGDFCVIHGSYTLQSGVSAARHIWRKANMLLITDSWECKSPEDMRQRFLLAPGVRQSDAEQSPPPQGGGRYTFIKDGIRLEIDVYSPVTPFVSAVTPAICSELPNAVSDTIALDAIAAGSRQGMLVTAIRFAKVEKKEN